MRLQRCLASAVFGLTLGTALAVQAVLMRWLLPGDDSSWSWPMAAATGLVVLALALYLRWLAPRLHRSGRPRWRMTPHEAEPILPLTVGVFVTALGVATSSYWPDWIGSCLGACAFAVATGWVLRRIEREPRT